MVDTTRKTKIIATLGPASDTAVKIEALIKAGANAVRLNLSHGDLEGHKRVFKAVREVSGRLNAPVAVIVDLQGPKIRVGRIAGGKAVITKGETLTITTGDVPGDSTLISTTYKGLPADVRLGDKLLFDDGLMEAVVKRVDGGSVVCEVITGGKLREHKGINLPGRTISAPSLTEKDIEGVRFAAEAGADYIALSFVRKASDVAALKERLAALGSDIPVIAKIEKSEAVENLDEIIRQADCIMIARGDLGVELTPEAVPVLQKRIIAKANAAGKTVITATQMLESMITNPRPTRAEASDVSNAVYDNTDCLMLSGETAVGRYPVESVEMMVRIVRETEEALDDHPRIIARPMEGPRAFAHAVTYAAFAACKEVSPKALVVFTQTGSTAGLLAQLRPSTAIIAFTAAPSAWRRLALVWGVTPYMTEFGASTDEMICRGEAALLDNGAAELGDTVVIISGTKVGMRGATNMMKIDWIGSEECKLYRGK
ncbi:MAG: pyruvate kinase [Deltaproteobacteria bacterium]|nr:pyruvate kinase [Deltaproteobacteria bacterium]